MTANSPTYLQDEGISHCFYLGIGRFSKNDLKRMKDCLGACSGTSCPAPVTVRKVNPLYTWLQPPICITTNESLYIYSWHQGIMFHDRKFKEKAINIHVCWFGNKSVKMAMKMSLHKSFSLHQKTQLTFPWSYHGYQLVTVGSFNASME